MMKKLKDLSNLVKSIIKDRRDYFGDLVIALTDRDNFEYDLLQAERIIDALIDERKILRAKYKNNK